MVTLVRLEQLLNALCPIEVTGKSLKVLGMSKEPLAVPRQSDTLYSVPSPFRVKVRSATVAACKDATSKEKNSRYLNFIPLVNKDAVGISRSKKGAPS